ncbi:hypothetical protein D3C71_1954500 [compost metagenome]
MRLLQHQAGRTVDAFREEIEDEQAGIEAQSKGQVAFLGRGPAHLKDMPEHQGVDGQHQQRRQQQPRHAQP